MPIRLVAPNIAVNTFNVESVHYTRDTDKYTEKHVVINFKDLSVELEPQYTMEEVCAALDGECYYRSEWTDEVGDIDVCVLHGQNSKHDPAQKGPFRLCLKREPYVTWGGAFGVYETHHAPDISQSWEVHHQRVERESQEAIASFNQSSAAPLIVLPPSLESDADFGIGYSDPPKKRGLWARLTGR